MLFRSLLIEHFLQRTAEWVRQDLTARFISLIKRTLDDGSGDDIWRTLRHHEHNLHARMLIAQFVLRYVLEGADLLEPRTIAYVQEELQDGRIRLWDIDGQQVSEAIGAVVARVVRDTIRSSGRAYKSLLPVTCLIGYLRAKKAYENACVAAPRSPDISPWLGEIGRASCRERV